MSTAPKSRSKNKFQETLADALRQAVDKHETGQFQVAKDLYHAILEKQPENPDANHNLGILYVELQYPTEALPYFRIALEKAPGCEQYWLSYIDALIKSKQFDGALQALQLGSGLGLSDSSANALKKLVVACQREESLQQDTASLHTPAQTQPNPVQEKTPPQMQSITQSEMIRFFRYSHDSHTTLNHNSKHRFAQAYALNIYRADAIYSFIPKNGCSTLRTSVAYANGCIENQEDFSWIHANNTTFSASLAELAKAKYAFTVLRCPFSRLASVYLDKIVGQSGAVLNLTEKLEREVHFEDISFAFFIKTLSLQAVKYANPHWRPQVDFLVYKDYDDYFALEEFRQAEEILCQKINLKMIDARKLTRHGIDGYSLQEGDVFAETSPIEIYRMKIAKTSPSPKALYNEELITIVQDLYKEDLKLYTSLFGDKNLLFS